VIPCKSVKWKRTTESTQNELYSHWYEVHIQVYKSRTKRAKSTLDTTCAVRELQHMDVMCMRGGQLPP
jgi:hypothetical protein